MKKARLIPAIFMLVLCVGILCIGIYSMTPASSNIAGTITVTASSAEVEITGYIQGQSTPVFSTTPTRTGITWNITNNQLLNFDASGADTIYDVARKQIRIHIKNKSGVALGAYFFKEGSTLPSDGFATADNVTVTSPIYDTKGTATTEDDTTMGTALLASYAYIAKNNDRDPVVANRNNNDEIDMTISLGLDTLSDADRTGRFSVNLNIEPYQTTLTADNYTTGTGLVKLPDSADFTSLEFNAFYNKTGLKYLVIPTNIQTIDSIFGSYSPNTEVLGISVPQNITTLNSEFNCSALQSINLSHVTSVGTRLLKDSADLKWVDISNVQRVGFSAFENCSSLYGIDVSSVTVLRDDAFDNCSSLASLEFTSLEQLDLSESAPFSSCSNLKTIHFPELLSIPMSLLRDLPHLSTIYIPKVTSIAGYYAIGGLPKLTSLDLSSAKTLSSYAIAQCSNLSRIILSTKLETIENYAFYDLPNDLVVTYNGTMDQFKAVTGYEYLVQVATVVCNDGEL